MEWLNYHHLLYFWVVARSGGITRATKELNLTPQTISAQIQSLEQALGHPLFNRVKRRLELTEAGQVVYEYADEIFTLGRELLDTLKQRPIGRALKLRVGVADVVPKTVVRQLLEPAMRVDQNVKVICLEGTQEELLGKLALHKLDVVLSDAPIPTQVDIRAFNHLLGECGVTFMMCGKKAAAYRKGFPLSLDGARFLLPTADTTLRRHLDQWFSTQRIRPVIVGEFADSALIKSFGQAGEDVFAVPSVIADEVTQQYRARPIGRTDDIVEQFYAISIERKIQHPAVAAVCEKARGVLFK